MNTISRRHFLGGAAALAGAVKLGADPLGLPIGCQVYPVSKALLQDFPGTLRELAAIGYKTIEMCSPAGYNWAPLAKMTPAELKQTITAAGLKCESSHFQARELRDSLEDRIAFAKGLGLKQMVLSSFGLPKEAKLPDWGKAADDLNKVGEKVQKAGMQLGFHNHDMEFAELDGVLIYDHLMSRFDPKLVKMQFQVSVISRGYKAATYFNKYPGRFCSVHLQDWSATEKKGVPVGTGAVDWKELFAAAKKAGVKNYFAEVSMDFLKASYPFLHGLKV
jgi:sugar phosphate isomerase/epimerase